MSYLQFAILATGSIAVYVLLAQGIVLTYRASGIVNFAQSGYAMVGAYAFYETHVVSGWPVILSIPLSLLIAAALGMATSALVIRPLRRSSPLIRLIATLAVLTILQSAATIRYTSNVYFYPPFLPHAAISFAGLDLPEDRIWLLGLALACTLCLHLLSTRTRFGLATLGLSESELTAETLGWSAGLLSSTNWALSGALAGLAGILIVPIDGLAPTSLTLLLIPALACALVGGFSSFAWGLVGAVLLGVTQSELSGHVTSQSLSGIPAAVPFIVIVVLLVVRGRSLPVRGYLAQRLPKIADVRLSPALLMPLLAVGIVLTLTLPVSWIPYFTVTEVAAVFVISVVLLTGYAGQLSLAQYAIGGVAALVAGRLVVVHLPFSLALFVGIGAGVATGLVFAMPALRTRGVNLAVVTIGLGVAVYYAVFSNEAFTGYENNYSVGPQQFLGLDIDPLLRPRNFAIFVLVWLIICAALATNVRRSRAGRRLIAVRTNERAAAALGVNVYGAKIFAFAVSAGVAGLGGVLFAFDGYSIAFSNFDPLESINLVQESVLGGVGYVSAGIYGGQFASGGIGTLIGSAIVGSNAVNWVALVGSALLIPVLILNPDGIAAGNSRALSGMLRKLLPASPGVAAGPPSAGSGVRKAVGEDGQRRTGLRATHSGGAVLQVRDVVVRFGGIQALSGVNIDVREGEILGLIGPNGAGKSTLVDVISGYTRYLEGTVMLCGAGVDNWPAYKRSRAGISRTFQSLELFEDLSVADNLLSAIDTVGVRGYLAGLVRPDSGRLPVEAQQVIASIGLESDLQTPVRELPYGRRRLVAVARALVGFPKVVLLDEPTAGLSSEESQEVVASLKRLQEDLDLAVLVVEHDMEVVAGLCDRVVVLDFGRLIAEGPPLEVLRNERVVGAYLGKEFESMTAEVPQGPQGTGRTERTGVDD